MMLVSQAVFARMCRTTPKTVTKWKQAGKLVLQGLQVDVESTAARMSRVHRTGSPIVLSVEEAVLAKDQGNAIRRLRGSNGGGNLAPLLCTEITARLEALDWTQTFDWAPAAQAERARKAAACVGWDAVQSDLRDDGHWGGFQLRIAEHLATNDLDEDAICAGFGFELYPEDVFKAVREQFELIFDEGDTEAVRLDLLHSLAHPFNEYDRPPN